MNAFLKTAIDHYSKSRFRKMVSMLVVVVFLLVACTKRHEDTLGTVSPGNGSGPATSFAVDVDPIVQSSCAASSGCHGSGSSAGPGPLLTYTQVFNARSSIRSAVLSGRMPPNGGLSVTQKNSIIFWIDSGAPNN